MIDRDGAPLGTLPPFPVEAPWWPEAREIVTGARERHGLHIAVLRLLRADRPAQPGGEVTYLAQTADPVAGLAPVEVDLSDHPLRAAYARPGGPETTVRWATGQVTALGLGPVEAIEQRRTWNLSGLWTLTVPSGRLWLKHVPAFFAHESATLRWLADRGHTGRTPHRLADDGLDGRMLLAEAPGTDLYGVDEDVCDAIAASFHRIQVSALESGDPPPVPDGRFEVLAAGIRRVVAEHGGGDPRLESLVDGLAERLARVAKCGVPETLCHGDLHPGNVVGDGSRHTIIDWGDSHLGHPAFDILRLTGHLPAPGAERLIARWAERWRAAVPGCDPLTAVDLLRPVAALRHAVVYATFLARIEPDEHPYHRLDVPEWLEHAARHVA